MNQTKKFQNTPPVFLCGYPKSGTTLLLALLDNHPELLVFPEESKFFSKVMGHPDRGIEYVLDKTGVNAFRYDEVSWQSGYRDYSEIDFEQYKASLESCWQQSDQSDYALLECVMSSYGKITGQMNPTYWVEKTPRNELYLKDALQRWPELRAIYILRDPRDNFCSYRKKRQYDKKSFSLENFIQDWSRSLFAWETLAKSSAQTLLIRYDDLVSHPKETMKKTCQFLKIDWDDTLVEPTRNGVFWSGNSMHKTEFKGISTASLQKYKSLLEEDEVRFLETWLESVMTNYEWALDFPLPTVTGKIRSFFFNGKADLVTKLKMLHSLRKV